MYIMEKYLNVVLLLVIIVLLYNNSQILPKDSVLGKMVLVAAIICVTHKFGRNSGLLMTVITIIILHNTYIREYFEGGEVATEGEETAEEEEEEEEEEAGIEAPSTEGNVSKMNLVDLQDTINKSPFIATMEAAGQNGGEGQINKYDSDKPDEKKEAVAVETSPLRAKDEQTPTPPTD
ncbi:GON-4-like protein isoform X1 [uncultured Mediterranean phage]|nr:GON-4-like protein isoform X1 [uncultured Mediterranean phage]